MKNCLIVVVQLNNELSVLLMSFSAAQSHTFCEPIFQHLASGNKRNHLTHLVNIHKVPSDSKTIMSHSSENLASKWQLSCHLVVFTYQHHASQQASPSAIHEVTCSAFLRSYIIIITTSNFIPFQTA